MSRDVARYLEKFNIMLAFTQSLASLSTCRRLQVAATVVDSDFTRVLAIGYNGPASHLPNNNCNGIAGSCGCVHAEANALIKLRDRTDNMFLITTHSPCTHCAGLIMNTPGIREVFCLHKYRVDNTMPFTMIGDNHAAVLERWATRSIAR